MWMRGAPSSHSKSTDTSAHHFHHLLHREFCCLLHTAWESSRTEWQDIETVCTLTLCTITLCCCSLYGNLPVFNSDCSVYFRALISSQYHCFKTFSFSILNYTVNMHTNTVHPLTCKWVRWWGRWGLLWTPRPQLQSEPPGGKWTGWGCHTEPYPGRSSGCPFGPETHKHTPSLQTAVSNSSVLLTQSHAQSHA